MRTLIPIVAIVLFLASRNHEGIFVSSTIGNYEEVSQLSSSIHPPIEGSRLCTYFTGLSTFKTVTTFSCNWFASDSDAIANVIERPLKLSK